MRASTFVVVLSILVAALLGAAAAESARANGLVARVDARVQGLPPRKLLQLTPAERRAARRAAIQTAKVVRNDAFQQAKVDTRAAIQEFKNQKVVFKGERRDAINDFKEDIQDAKELPTAAERRDAFQTAKGLRNNAFQTAKENLDLARVPFKEAIKTAKNNRRAAIVTFKDSVQAANAAVFGCTTDSADNYDPNATEDDGSCITCGSDDGLPNSVFDSNSNSCICENSVNDNGTPSDNTDDFCD